MVIENLFRVSIQPTKVQQLQKMGFHCVRLLSGGGLDWPDVLVRDPAQARNPLEGSVQANDGLAVVAAEARDPVVVLSKLLAGMPYCPVQVSRGLGNPVVKPIDAPLLEV